MAHDYKAGSTRAVGQAFEDLAVAHLERQGLTVVERNVECAGVEIDVVARDDDGRVVFVEVRSRGRGDRGHPLETVDERKQRRLIRGATAWLCERQLWERVDVRFDVVAIVDTGSGGRPTIEHVRDAWWA